jgi:hypothetical protein
VDSHIRCCSVAGSRLVRTVALQASYTAITAFVCSAIAGLFVARSAAIASSKIYSER